MLWLISCSVVILIQDWAFTFREHGHKTLIALSQFWQLRGWVGLSESVKRGKFVIKIFFQIAMNDILKISDNVE